MTKRAALNDMGLRGSQSIPSLANNSADSCAEIWMLQRLAMGTALLASLLCNAAYCLGLGEIQVSSRLNQPLTATIPLTSLSEDEAESLHVQLASPTDFEKAGVERSDYLSSLKFSVSGNKVKISSDEIAREPFIALLVEARAGNSRVLRGYTVLLDLPTVPSASDSSASTQGRFYETAEEASRHPATTLARADVQAPVATPMSDAPPSSSNASVAQSAQAQQPTSYGPIRSGQTFWSVANKLRPDPSLVSIDQTMLALYTANPQAFIGGINGLLIGSTLRVPTVDEMRAVPEPEARHRVQALRAASSAAAAGGVAMAAPAKPAAEKPPVVEAETPIKTLPADAAPAAATTPEPAAAAETPPTPETPAATTDAAPPAAVDVTTPTAPDSTAAGDTPPTTEPAAAEPPAAAPPVSPPSPVVEPARSVPPESYPVSWILVPLVLVLLAILIRRIRRRAPAAAAEKKPDVAPPVVPVAATAAVAVAAAPVEEPAPAISEPVEFVGEEAAAIAPAEAPVVIEEFVELDEPVVDPLPETPEVEEPAPVEIDLAPPFEIIGPSLDQLDPIAEADFHLSYGLYDEAVRGLLEAIAAEPDRNDLQVKLAETYFAAGRSDDFESLAQRLQSRLGPSDWSRLMFMGSQLCPDSPLFRDEADVEPHQPEPQPEHRGNEVEFTLEPLPDVPPQPAAPPVETGNLLEFELSEFDASAPVDVASWHTQNQWQTPAPAATSAPAGLDLSNPNVIEFEPLPDIDPDDIDLFDPEPEVEIATDDEVGTKLDLARAYLDMGDNQMARDLLAEVALQGNPAQQSDAQSLLQRLPV
jgi:pilus assembly protein FimV